MNLEVKDHIDYVMLVLTIVVEFSVKQTVNVPEGGNTDATLSHCYVCVCLCVCMFVLFKKKSVRLEHNDTFQKITNSKWTEK